MALAISVTAWAQDSALPDLSIHMAMESGALFQDASGSTWPHALMDLSIMGNIRLWDWMALEAGGRISGVSSSPISTELSYQPGFSAWGSTLGVRFFIPRSLGFTSALNLELMTARSQLASLYFFYPALKLDAGFVLGNPLKPAWSTTLSLFAAVQFRQDPQASWSLGLKASVPLAMCSPPWAKTGADNDNATQNGSL